MSNSIKTLLALSLVAFIAACGSSDPEPVVFEEVEEEPSYDKF